MLENVEVTPEIFVLLSGAALIIAVAVIILFYVFISRKNQLIHEQNKYEKKLMNLELHALRSQMNPHFVHNSLNAIQYYIQLNAIDQSENYLTRFSKLVRQFFEYSRKQTIYIAEEIDLLNNYLSLEQLRFEDKLAYKILVDDAFDQEQKIPSMILQPIVENAVNHGVFHKKSTGTITILFQQLSYNSYKVTIDDDGIGIHKSKTIQKKSSGKYSSHSSQVIEERLSLLKQIQDWEVQYTIEDKSDLGTDEGTLVTLIFKLP